MDARKLLVRAAELATRREFRLALAAAMAIVAVAKGLPAERRMKDEPFL